MEVLTETTDHPLVTFNRQPRVVLIIRLAALKVTLQLAQTLTPMQMPARTAMQRRQRLSCRSLSSSTTTTSSTDQDPRDIQLATVTHRPTLTPKRKRTLMLMGKVISRSPPRHLDGLAADRRSSYRLPSSRAHQSVITCTDIPIPLHIPCSVIHHHLHRRR